MGMKYWLALANLVWLGCLPAGAYMRPKHKLWWRPVKPDTTGIRAVRPNRHVSSWSSSCKRLCLPSCIPIFHAVEASAGHPCR